MLTYHEFWEKDAIHNSEDLMEALNEFVVSKRESANTSLERFLTHYVIILRNRSLRIR